VYDPATNAWTTKTQIPKPVSHVTSATFVMGGRILVMGGESAHNAQVRDVFAYNPATDGWTPLTPLPAARFSGAAGVVNGKIYFSTGGSQATTWEGTPA
jgi:N-acetylneuraminic acid mutarotase